MSDVARWNVRQPPWLAHSAGWAQPACYISVHHVPLSALRRMALQDVKRVAWPPYQLELKDSTVTTRSTT